MGDRDPEVETLSGLEPGMPILFGGDRVVRVPADLAAAFAPGDRLIVLERTGDLLHVTAAAREAADTAITRAVAAFGAMAEVDDASIDAFYRAFADRLDDDATFAPIAEANAADVSAAADAGQTTTRLELTRSMRDGMVAGLVGWTGRTSRRGDVLETVLHDGWRIDQVAAGLGVVGFVFEGRPNVFADATGVIKGGNTVVFRIGRAALGTARAIVTHALEPALAEAGLPAGAAALVDEPSRAAGWAMFDDPRLALAVARGSGPAVDQLGAVASRAGTPVSLHGTGGGWIVAADDADPAALRTIVASSLDRKVCNTLNTCCVPRAVAGDLVPAVLGGLDDAATARGTHGKVHVTRSAAPSVPEERFDVQVEIVRATGTVLEPSAELIGDDALGTEWEWEHSPEITLVVVDDVDDAVDRFNTQSPKLVACLVSADPARHDRFFAEVDAPFVGNGFTRWVDGQYALGRPELGLSNWQNGRLFARGGVLSGDSVYTVRTRATQDSPDLHR